MQFPSREEILQVLTQHDLQSARLNLANIIANHAIDRMTRYYALHRNYGIAQRELNAKLQRALYDQIEATNKVSAQLESTVNAFEATVNKLDASYSANRELRDKLRTLMQQQPEHERVRQVLDAAVRRIARRENQLSQMAEYCQQILSVLHGYTCDDHAQGLRIGGDGPWVKYTSEE